MLLQASHSQKKKAKLLITRARLETESARLADKINACSDELARLQPMEAFPATQVRIRIGS